MIRTDKLVVTARFNVRDGNLLNSVEEIKVPRKGILCGKGISAITEDRLYEGLTYRDFLDR